MLFLETVWVSSHEIALHVCIRVEITTTYNICVFCNVKAEVKWEDE